MIALGTSQALEGSTTTATTVTYTITGLLMSDAAPPVASSYEVLAQGQMATTAGSMYNPGTSATALISSIYLNNTSSSVAQSVVLYIGGTAADNEIFNLTIPADGVATYEDGLGWQVYTSNGVQEIGAGLTSTSTYTTATVAVSATTITNITSLSLSPGTWLIFGSAYAHLTTATLGHGDVWLGPTSASKTGAYVAATISMGDIAGGTEDDTATLVTVQTFTTTTTVYMEIYCSEATTVEYESDEESIANTTGILAVKIG